MAKKKVSAAPAAKARGWATAIARQEKEVRAYVADQAHERVIHVEKAGSELVGPARYDIWDVHCVASRWWVVTNPINLYSQQDFKSRDVVLTFHIGLMLRVSHMQEREVPVRPEKADLLPGSWRRWQQAFEAYDGGDEAETFQSVGVRLRECLVSFVGETCTPQLVPTGEASPKRSDFKAWTELLANHVASGEGVAKLRSYLKKVAVESWEYVNWLTHAKNAIRLDAEIGLKMVEHLLGMFSAARLRAGRTELRCAACQSYRVVAGTCQQCDWIDPSHAIPGRLDWTAEERARRLAEPCTPSSDISTFTSPSDLLRR